MWVELDENYTHIILGIAKNFFRDYSLKKKKQKIEGSEYKINCNHSEEKHVFKGSYKYLNLLSNSKKIYGFSFTNVKVGCATILDGQARLVYTRSVRTHSIFSTFFYFVFQICCMIHFDVEGALLS